jgi:hypothetical protein
MNSSAQLNFEENIVLVNEFVLLRPLQLNDFNYLLNFSLTEPEIWKYSSMQAIGADGLKIISIQQSRRAKKKRNFHLLFLIL